VLQTVRPAIADNVARTLVGCNSLSGERGGRTGSLGGGQWGTGQAGHRHVQQLRTARLNHHHSLYGGV